MGDFEIYADALEHPLLQRFNDLLNLHSLSHYVNFPSCKMGHTLELGLLLNLHHSNILLFFLRICSLKFFLPFLAFTVAFTSCPRLSGAFKSMTLHEDSSQSQPKPPPRSLSVPSVCLHYVSSFGQLYGIPACRAFPFIPLVQCTVKHTVAILIWTAFFSMKLRFTSLHFCKQEDWTTSLSFGGLP